jgi:hypothetical protein
VLVLITQIRPFLSDLPANLAAIIHGSAIAPVVACLVHYYSILIPGLIPRVDSVDNLILGLILWFDYMSMGEKI